MLCCQYCGRTLPNTSAVCECRMKPAFDDGGAAFPSGGVDVAANKVESPVHDGMSLRDWFAGQALAGMGTWCPWVNDGHNQSVADLSDPRVLAARAAWASAQADAMLAERAKRGK